MKSATLKFVPAICVTLMDILVIRWCGPLLWNAWNGVCWARIGLLLLAGSIAFTLMDIWAKTLAPMSVRRVNQIGNELEVFSSPKAMEGADV